MDYPTILKYAVYTDFNITKIFYMFFSILAARRRKRKSILLINMQTPPETLLQTTQMQVYQYL